MNPQWPEFRFDEWKETYETLHRWMQIVGKIRLTKSIWVNHGWHSTFLLTPQGLTTSLVHDDFFGFSIEFNFVHHMIQILLSDGKACQFPLISESVADFYVKITNALQSLGIEVHIYDRPNELPDTTPFTEDFLHRTYDSKQSNRFWRVLLQADRVMKEFRARFIGKVSPVHFFWGSFDLAVTRFSGRRAPEHPGGIPHLPDLITREAYSHEVSSCGFWPGHSQHNPFPAFYSYAYPKPNGFENAKVFPKSAFFHPILKEYILPYEALRTEKDPESALMAFFESTYEAAAHLGNWNRFELEKSPYLEILQSRSRAA